jgi:hypothetical protein
MNRGSARLFQFFIRELGIRDNNCVPEYNQSNRKFLEFTLFWRINCGSMNKPYIFKEIILKYQWEFHHIFGMMDPKK